MRRRVVRLGALATQLEAVRVVDGAELRLRAVVALGAVVAEHGARLQRSALGADEADAVVAQRVLTRRAAQQLVGDRVEVRLRGRDGRRA